MTIDSPTTPHRLPTLIMMWWSWSLLLMRAAWYGVVVSLTRDVVEWPSSLARVGGVVVVVDM
jgi:hypothetical protein